MSKKLATVHITGVISSSGECNANRICDLLTDAATARNTEAVAVIINSPGGSPVQSKMIYDHIRKLSEEGVCIAAFCEDICASGGYYIASACDSIFVNPMTIIGSVGVISSGFGFPELLQKIGVERRVTTAGENKSRLDPFKPLKEEDVEWHEEIMKKIHKQFVADVTATRLVDGSLLNGEVFLGSEAINNGMADKIMDVRTHAAQCDLEVKQYGKKSLMAAVLTKFGSSMYNAMCSVGNRFFL